MSCDSESQQSQQPPRTAAPPHSHAVASSTTTTEEEKQEDDGLVLNCWLLAFVSQRKKKDKRRFRLLPARPFDHCSRLVRLQHWGRSACLSVGAAKNLIMAVIFRLTRSNKRSLLLFSLLPKYLSLASSLVVSGSLHTPD